MEVREIGTWGGCFVGCEASLDLIGIRLILTLS
jgi:hypothetical protein